MGNKGAQTQTTQSQNQTSTYAPNAQAAGYITNAMDKATGAASNPFAIPQAPVAGFSQDQQQAFQQYRDAQGTAQPYYNQAASYFSPQGAQDFLNPYAANVMAGMKDVFGSQQSQLSGNLVNAAGGVGADRIGVGQAELGKQQSLAAGQTLSGMYGQAAQQAQQAGQGQMALGQAAQNSAFQGAGQLLGAGNAQQQLQQQQLNSPYQQQMAQAAFPYQQAQFLSGITGALAPGLGGTTQSYGYGSGTSKAPAPSIWSQVLGAGTAAAGAYGAYNSGKGSNPSYGMGNGVYGGSSQNPLPGLDASDYGEGYARGGPASPYDIDFTRRADGSYGYAEGGGVSDDPIDVSQGSIIPNIQQQAIKPTIPQANLNLNPPQQSGGSDGGKGGGLGDMIGSVVKLAPMFLARGGTVPGYDEGGATFDDRWPFRTRSAEPAPEPVPAEEPYRLDPGAMEKWRNDTPAQPMAFAGDDPAAASLPPAIRTGASRAAPAPSAANDMNPYSPPSAAPPGRESNRESTSLASSPWAALMAAGLGMMGGTSPYAGVNIGQGGMQGVKMLQAQREAAQKDETIDQASRHLAQEAKFHEDQYTRITKAQEIAQASADRPYKELTKYQQAQIDQEQWALAGSIMTKSGLHPAFYDKKSLQVIDGVTKKPPVETDTVIPKGGSRNSPEEISSVVDAIADGSQPPTLTGLYGDSIHVRAGLNARSFNLAKAQQEWKNAERLGASVNSSRMVSYVGLNGAVDKTIDRVKELADQMKQSGIPFMNKLQLESYINLQGNSPKGQLATQYRTQIGVLKEEFANLANGGYAPTEPAWKLANEQVNGNFGQQQLHASLDEIQRVIRYRIQSIPGMATMGPNSTNRYSGTGAPPPAHGATPPAVGAKPGQGGGTKPSVTTRFNELIGGGKSEEETYVILKEEGYQ